MSGRRAFTAAVVCLTFGCEGDCKLRRCEALDTEPGPGATWFELRRDQSFVSFELDGHATESPLLLGELAFDAPDPSCVAAPSTPCTLTLNRLRLRLASARIETGGTRVFIEEPELSVQAPLELVDRGFGFVIPSGTEVQTCLLTDGRRDSARTPLDEPATLKHDPNNGRLLLAGLFPVRFHGGDGDCRTFDASANIVATAAPR